VKFAFIEDKKVAFPVEPMCRVLGVSSSGYYAWRERPASERAKADARLAVEVVAAHQRSRATYGSPRVHAELRARGVRVGRKRVERLMRERDIQARRKRRFRRTTDSNHSNPVAPNILARRFEPTAPNAAWVTDVTYVWTDEGWLYLAIMLDLFARKVIGWATSAVNDTALALAALDAALSARRPPAGLVHHSDRGSPYASAEYRAALESRGIVPSMSRTGDCWDNSVAESFFATIKAELIDLQRFSSRAGATSAVADYIEAFYNPQRRHSYLGFISPIEFELKAHLAALAA
jgi:putative transposase